MDNLFSVGRIFYGTAVVATGLQTIYYHDFPYWLVPPKHAWIPGIAVIAYASGMLLVAAGTCIVFEKRIRSASLLLGAAMLFIFCFCYLPFEIFTTADLRWPVWHNAEKEISFAGGALVIAGCYSAQNEKPLINLLGKLIPPGIFCFSLPMISFGVLHWLLAKDVSTMVPSWIPFPMFWTYLAGLALAGSGLAIILKIKIRLVATLLGVMIFSWFVLLHIPRVIASPPEYLGSEVTSAFLALAYSGISLVISRKVVSSQWILSDL